MRSASSNGRRICRGSGWTCSGCGGGCSPPLHRDARKQNTRRSPRGGTIEHCAAGGFGFTMTDTLKVLSICGSLRKGSYNAALARMAPKLAPAGLSFHDAPSFADMPIYNFDAQNSGGFPAPAVAWADAIRAADGILIVSPEYNWSIPGGLKNAIDWVSRMQDQLRQSLVSLDVHWFGRPEVIVSFAAQKFDAATLELKDQTAIDMVKAQLAGFEKFIRMVKG